MNRIRTLMMPFSFFLFIHITQLMHCSTLFSQSQPSSPIISPSYEKNIIYTGREQIECWYYVPEVLKDGDSAPVVVYLHGGMFSYPDIYSAHVEHLVKQGYIVIFPRYIHHDPINMYRDLIHDADQYRYLERAVAATRHTLEVLGPIAQIDNITIYGHSTVGALALAWPKQGIHPRNMLLANTSIHAGAMMPAFVTSLIRLKEIEWQESARQIDYPTVILCGEDDTIGSCQTSIQIFRELTLSPQKALYMLHSDRHELPGIFANHFAPLATDKRWLSVIFKMTQTDATPDIADYQFYWTALDHLLMDQVLIRFDMGSWSDGTPIKPVTMIGYETEGYYQKENDYSTEKSK